MKLIAAMIWYDEPIWSLTELIASLGKAGVDAFVAVDGAFAAFPEGKAQSPSEQAQTILAACQGAGMECVLHIPREPWFGNEVEKRSFAFATAHLIAEPGEDWIWVADADEVVTEAIGVREALERTEHDAGQVTMEGVFESGKQGQGQWPLRKLFRAQESGIKVINNHFTYVSGDGQLLYEGYCVPKPQLVDAETMHFVRIDHRNSRTLEREHAAQRYYDRRKEQGLELVPG